MSSQPNPQLKNAVLEAATIPVTNPHGIEPIYANNLGVAATMADFTFFFVETGQLPGEKGPSARSVLKAAVTMPMAAAPAVIQALNQMMKNTQEIVAARTAAAQPAQPAGKTSGPK